jgi:hypothetical protein
MYLLLAFREAEQRFLLLFLEKEERHTANSATTVNVHGWNCLLRANIFAVSLLRSRTNAFFSFFWKKKDTTTRDFNIIESTKPQS